MLLLINCHTKLSTFPFPSFSSVIQVSVVCPLLKKPTLDSEVLDIYRPISNIPFLPKVLENMVEFEPQVHLKQKFLSLFRVVNDLLMTTDAGSPSLVT